MRNPLDKPLTEGVPVYAPPISRLGKLFGINARDATEEEPDPLVIFAYIVATLAGAVGGAIVAILWLY